MVLKNSVSIKISFYFHWDLYSIVESSVRWCLIQTGSACPSLANQRERHQLHCGCLVMRNICLLTAVQLEMWESWSPPQVFASLKVKKYTLRNRKRWGTPLTFISKSWLTVSTWMSRQHCKATISSMSLLLPSWGFFPSLLSLVMIFLPTRSPKAENLRIVPYFHLSCSLHPVRSSPLFSKYFSKLFSLPLPLQTNTFLQACTYIALDQCN